MKLLTLPKIVFCAAVAVCLYGQSGAELKNEVARLEAVGGEDVGAGRLADAEPLLERAVAIAIEGNGFSDGEQAAAHIARGNLYHAMAEREGSTPSWNDLAGLDYWHAGELLKGSPDTVAQADAMIRWASTMVVPSAPSPGDLVPGFLDALLTAALNDLEKAQGDSGPAVELAKTQLVRVNTASKRRDQIDRFCPTTLVDGNQIGLLTECSAAALDAGKFTAAESFAKRADALLASEPAASFVRDRVRASLVLAESAHKQGHLDDAHKAADQAVKLCREYLGPNHGLRAESLRTQAKVLDELKMKPESQRAAKEAENIEAANKKHATNPRLVAPRLLYRETPTYPPQAKTSHVGGRIFLLCEIGADGTARVLASLNRLGYGLDDAAIAAIQQWRFDPMKKDGQPVALDGTIEVTFKPN